jgi:pimeloyl-ACP methyl ester carboxylesterase
MPFNILGIWFRGLLGVAIIVAGAYLLKRWYDASQVIEPIQLVAPVEQPHDEAIRVERPRAPERAPVPGVGLGRDRGWIRAMRPATPGRRIFRPNLGWNEQTALLAAGSSLLVWAVLGRLLVMGGVSILQRALWTARGSRDIETIPPSGGETHRISRPDGSEISLECIGPADAPPIILTHGWGANAAEWVYARKHLSDTFRLIIWDIPGLGRSRKPLNNDYSLDKLAADLDVVLAFACEGDQRALLVGHSIGGMITLNFCKRFPEALRTQVSGLLLAHTTYTNPIRTTRMAGLYTLLEKPLIVPLLHLTIALWPLVWIMTWLSYWNGSIHRSTARDSFAGTETWAQLDLLASLMPRARPDILARGMLGMIDYDATSALPGIDVPVLTIVGDLDSTTPPEAGQFIARSVPDGRLETLAPAKHAGLIEHDGRFDALVGQFAGICLGAGALS